MNPGLAAIGAFLAVQLAVLCIRLIYRRPILRNLNVEMAFSMPRATEGDALFLCATLTNAKWLPLPWVAVKFRVSRHLLFADRTATQVSDFYYRQDLYHILMHQRLLRRFNFVCGKRGYYRIQGLDLSCWDILMERKTSRFVDSDTHLTVYPSRLEADVLEELCTHVYGQLSSVLPMHPDPFSFRGIREYSPRDPMKAVNFKASAKGTQNPQELMVNLWEFTNNRRAVLLLNLEKHSLLHTDALDEYAIKVAASLAGRLADRHVPTRFAANGVNGLTGAGTELPEGRGYPHHESLLDALAHIDLAQGVSEPFASLLERLATDITDAEYIWVSTYHGADLEEAYTRLIERGIRVAWVVPRNHGLRLEKHDLRETLRERVVLI
jgi:uncharacterized protein (DUF58 family)